MKAYLEQLIEYNYWANGLIMKHAEMLTIEQFLEQQEIFGESLRGILNHVMFAEWIWLDRMHGKVMTLEEMRSFFREEKYQDTKQLYEDWFDLEMRMRAFLASLSNEQIRGTFKYTRTDGLKFEDKYSDIFTQLALHGMQHRSECAAILTSLGHSPGNIDYITFLRS